MHAKPKTSVIALLNVHVFMPTSTQRLSCFDGLPYFRVIQFRSQSQLQPPPADLLVDLRSDTVTKPTHDMRRAMMEAPVGDDVFGEDDSIQVLQQRCAELTGHRRRCFVLRHDDQPDGHPCTLDLEMRSFATSSRTFTTTKAAGLPEIQGHRCD